jgi:predicted SprT family Zn-dependent metalloprotease
MNIRETRQAVIDLFVEHNLVGWSFVLGRGKNLLGTCCHRKREIKISRYQIQLGTDAEILDTIRHEVAHALIPVKHGHDWVWRQKARELGAIPKACQAQSWNVPHKWEIWCGNCGEVIAKRYNRPNRGKLALSGCRKCGHLVSLGKLYVQRAIHTVPV